MSTSRAPRIDWLLMLAVLGLLTLGHPARLVRPPRTRDDLTGGDPTAYLRKQRGQRRHRPGADGRRDRPPSTAGCGWSRRWSTSASIVGPGAGARDGHARVNGSRSWPMLGGMSIQPAEFAQARRGDRHGPVGSPSAPTTPQPWRLGAGAASRPTWSVMLGDRRGAGGADPPAARPRHDAGAQRDGASGRWSRSPGRRVAGCSLLAGRRWSPPRSAAVAAGLPEGLPGGPAFLAFTDPDLDPQGAGYNVEQARIAIGNGGAVRRGPVQRHRRRARASCPSSTPTSCSPSRGEELGLVGAGLMIALLAIVIWRALAHRPAHRRRLRPGRRRRHRLLVRLPGVPEHRHVPGHHAGHRRTPALRVVRRQLDVRRPARRSGCCRTSTCAPTRRPTRVMAEQRPVRLVERAEPFAGRRASPRGNIRSRDRAGTVTEEWGVRVLGRAAAAVAASALVAALGPDRRARRLGSQTGVHDHRHAACRRAAIGTPRRRDLRPRW